MGKSYCIFSAQYLPTIGGVERYTYNLSKKLVEKGNEVTIVTSNINGLKEYEESDGIKIFRLPCYNLMNGRFPVLKFNSKLFQMMKTIKKLKFDLVIINTRFYLHSLYGARFAKKNNIKSIVIEHGTSHLTINNRIFDKLGEIVEHTITEGVKLYCKNFYGVSEACNEWLKHFNIDAKSTIYNSIDIDNIKELQENCVINYRKKSGLCEDDIIVTFTGRLVEEKGILNLIDAIKKINLQNKNVYLFVAGDGPLQEYINEIKTDNIIVLGKLDFCNVIALLMESNIFCLPSKSEGFPTSVLEAVACKCFIITTEKGGAKELISSKEYGIIMKSNDVNTIYDNIEYVLKDREYLKSAIELSLDKLVNNFTWDITSEKVIKLK